MTTELEQKLRVALHERGAAITADRLRPPTSIPRVVAEHRARSWGARLAPILAAAGVAALVASLALVLGGGSSHPGQTAGARPDTLTGVLGRTWTLTTVQAPDGTITMISPSIGATVTFLGSGDRINFQEGIGAFQAAYTRTDNGDLRVHGVSGGPGNYSGHDRSQLAAIAGIDAIGVPIHPYAPGPIRVQLSFGRLQITTQGYRLTFNDPEPVAPSASQLPPSPPTTTTTTAAHASPTHR